MATRNNASVSAVAKQQRQRGNSGGSAGFAAEPYGLHVAGINFTLLAFSFFYPPF